MAAGMPCCACRLLVATVIGLVGGAGIVGLAGGLGGLGRAGVAGPFDSGPSALRSGRAERASSTTWAGSDQSSRASAVRAMIQTSRMRSPARPWRISVIAVHDVLNDVMIPVPDPKAPLKDSDTLLVAGKDKDLEKAAKVG
mgnify:CR=1 FL=1